MPRKLKDIEVEELSLVRDASTRKKFYILKMEEKMDPELKELLGELFDEDELKKIDEEEKEADEILKGEDVEKQKKLSENAINAIKGAVNILNKYKEDLTGELATALKTLIKFATGKYPYPYPYPAKKEEVKKSDEEELADAVNVIIKAVDIDDVEKAGKVTGQFSKATIEQIKKIVEICTKLIGEKETKVKKKEELPPEIARDLEQLAELKKFKADTLKDKEEAQKKEVEELKKEKEDLKKELEELKKSKGIKKGIEGQGDEDGAGGEEEDKWKSLG